MQHKYPLFGCWEEIYLALVALKAISPADTSKAY